MIEGFSANDCFFPEDEIEVIQCEEMGLEVVRVYINDSSMPSVSVVLDDDDTERLYEWLGKALGKHG